MECQDGLAALDGGTVRPAEVLGVATDRNVNWSGNVSLARYLTLSTQFFGLVVEGTSAW